MYNYIINFSVYIQVNICLSSLEIEDVLFVNIYFIEKYLFN